VVAGTYINGNYFFLVRAIDAALIVSDTLSNNIFRACKTLCYKGKKNTNELIVLYELPWQFGICAFTCYLFGIAHTVSHVRKKKASLLICLIIYCINIE
jgi:hypothetical protein